MNTKRIKFIARLLVALATLLVGCSTAIAIPLSEIIRVERAKLEYEKTEYWVYCVWGKMQSDPKDCAKDKANLIADLKEFLKLLDEESFGNFKDAMDDNRKFANKVLKAIYDEETKK